MIVVAFLLGVVVVGAVVGWALWRRAQRRKVKVYCTSRTIDCGPSDALAEETANVKRFLDLQMERLLQQGHPLLPAMPPLPQISVDIDQFDPTLVHIGIGDERKVAVFFVPRNGNPCSFMAAARRVVMQQEGAEAPPYLVAKATLNLQRPEPIKCRVFARAPVKTAKLDQPVHFR